MDLEHLASYIIPIVMLVLYFVLNAKVKKEAPQVRREEVRDQPSRQRRAPPPAARKIAPSQSQAKPAASAFHGGVINKRVLKFKKKSHAPSYASKLVKGRSLRQAFLMKEILNRPYEP